MGGWLEIEFIHETHFFYIRHPKDVYMRVNGRDVNCIDMKTGQAQFTHGVLWLLHE